MSESEDVVRRVVEATGEAPDLVRSFCVVLHETVDECLTDDISVVAPPLVVGRPGCPVLDRLLLRLADVRWPMPESLDVPVDQLAGLLRLPRETVESYPLVGRFGLLAKVVDRLLVRDEDAARYLAMLDAWLACFEAPSDGSPRAYRVWPLPGYAFEDWLLARIQLLHACDFPVRLAELARDGVAGRGHVFVDGRPADLVLRFDDDCGTARAGDWLVVTSKTTAVGAAACTQLATSVDWLRAEVETGEVHGLLIADGMSVDLERSLRERPFFYLSLTMLGYRRWVRLHSPVLPDPAPDGSSIDYPANLPARQLADSRR